MMKTWKRSGERNPTKQRNTKQADKLRKPLLGKQHKLKREMFGDCRYSKGNGSEAPSFFERIACKINLHNTEDCSHHSKRSQHAIVKFSRLRDYQHPLPGEEKNKIGFISITLYVRITVCYNSKKSAQNGQNLQSLYRQFSESIKAKTHENNTPLLITYVNGYEYFFPDVDYLVSFKFWFTNITRFVVLSLSFIDLRFLSFSCFHFWRGKMGLENILTCTVIFGVCSRIVLPFQEKFL